MTRVRVARSTELSAAAPPAPRGRPPAVLGAANVGEMVTAPESPALGNPKQKRIAGADIAECTRMIFPWFDAGVPVSAASVPPSAGVPVPVSALDESGVIMLVASGWPPSSPGLLLPLLLSSPLQPEAKAPPTRPPATSAQARPPRIKVNLRISTLLAEKDEDCESVSPPAVRLHGRSQPVHSFRASLRTDPPAAEHDTTRD